jgi:hypothetical protein
MTAGSLAEKSKETCKTTDQNMVVLPLARNEKRMLS